MPAKKEKKKKTFKVKLCPKCNSDDIGVAVGGKIGMWECRKCGYRGPGIIEKEMSEEEYLDYLDKKGEEMPELGEPTTVEEKKSHKEMLKEKMVRGEKV